MVTNWPVPIKTSDLSNPPRLSASEAVRSGSRCSLAGIHRGVDFIVRPITFRPSTRKIALQQDFAARMVLLLEKFDNLRNIIVDSYGAWISGLSSSSEFGLDVGRCKFQNFDRVMAELVA